MTYPMTAIEGLVAKGIDISKPIRSDEKILVDMGSGRFKHYSFRFRKKDSKIISRGGNVTKARNIGAGTIIFSA